MRFTLSLQRGAINSNANHPGSSPYVKQELFSHCLRTVLALLLFAAPSLLFAQSTTLHISKRYLNIPIENSSPMRVFQIQVDGAQRREFPAQLAEQSPDYWIFLDVSEFKDKTITIAGPSSQSTLNRIYQSDEIQGANSLYREPARPQFHFTVKRGWSNDVNGPIFYKGQYHLFWQAFPFGVNWDTGFMYWGHAVSRDLVHWRELAPALMLDRLGSPWSGSSLVDHNNVGGWGKDALVLFYTAFDRHTKKQVQCIAYSTDNGATFTRYAGNPVLDTNSEVGSNDTRDPHVFWYNQTRHWVMVLFEKDGLSIFTSNDLKQWTRKSRFKGLYECPDLFELPIDGDPHHTRWVLHGGSANYYIGSFDGEAFTPESPELHYAEGKNHQGDDLLYAAQSFAEMPDGRRIQMAWGRVKFEGMPFTQMMLFPTQFRLVTTPEGLRMRATPIAEIQTLHRITKAVSASTLSDANRALSQAGSNPLDVRLDITLAKEDALNIRYGSNIIATVQPADLNNGTGPIEILIDKGIAEIFVNNGERYLLKELPTDAISPGLQFAAASDAIRINRLQISQMKSMWGPRDPNH